MKLNVFSCFILPIIIHLASSEVTFQCFNESERFTLTYANNASKPLDSDLLPTVRLFQGVYGSQYAMQWTVYVYLTELMGVNVSWFPSDDPNVWDDAEVIEAALGDIGYPDYYIKALVLDLADILVEIWGAQKADANADEFIKNRTLIDGEFSGVYGDVGWFVPSYLNEEQPGSIGPYYLKNDDDLRNLFIETSDSYIEYIHNVTNDTFSYDTPIEGIPIVFGSLPTYLMSTWSYNLTRNIFDYSGMNWSFVTLESEEALTQLMIEMYTNHEPFIANLYGPHVDFSYVINETTGETMEFEKVALPRNPSNTVSEECYIEAQCATPIDTLDKLANAKLEDRFEEMVTFLYNFEMDAIAVNSILLLQNELSHYNDDEWSDADIWAIAGCEWIKENRATVDQWFVSIERYDCPGSCGFTINNTDNIGGYCDEFSGECVCESDILTSDCRTSCPGLIGPIWNEESQNYTFQECSGHGTCDMDTLTCTADIGFGKLDCGYEYPLYDYNVILFAILTTLHVLLVIVFVGSVTWLHMHAVNERVKAWSINISTVFSIGLMMLSAGCIVYMIHPATDTTCILTTCLYGNGAILAIGASLLKAYRIALAFIGGGKHSKSQSKVKLSDTDLLKYLAFFVAIEVLFCVAYAVAHQLSGGVEIDYNDDYLRVETFCNSGDVTAAIEAINYIYGFVLLFTFTVIAFKNRNAPKRFTEHKCAFIGSFVSLIGFLIVLAFHAVVDDLDVIVSAQVVCTWLVLVVVWIMFYGKLFYKFYTHHNYKEKGLEMQLSANAGRRHGTDPTTSPQTSTTGTHTTNYS